LFNAFSIYQFIMATINTFNHLKLPYTYVISSMLVRNEDLKSWNSLSLSVMLIIWIFKYPFESSETSSLSVPTMKILYCLIETHNRSQSSIFISFGDHQLTGLTLLYQHDPVDLDLFLLSGFGVNICPRLEKTTSKVSSSNGRSCTFPSFPFKAFCFCQRCFHFCLRQNLWPEIYTCYFSTSL